MIVDYVYAAGTAANKIWGIEEKKDSGWASKNGCNRKEKKLMEKIRKSKRIASIVANEIQRRKDGRNATKKEKEDLKGVLEGEEELMSKVPTNVELTTIKANATDKVKVEQIRLQEWKRKSKRIRNNALFNKSERCFYRCLNKTPPTGEPPAMEKFENFWGGIWEEKKEVEKQQWMAEIETKLSRKVTMIKEMETKAEDIGMMVKKRKN